MRDKNDLTMKNFYQSALAGWSRLTQGVRWLMTSLTQPLWRGWQAAKRQWYQWYPSSRYENTLSINDIDDNFYSWFQAFMPAFQAMLDYVLEATGWQDQRDAIIAEIREVTDKHWDTEYAGTLKEIPSFQALAAADPSKADAIYAKSRAIFNATMGEHLSLMQGAKQWMDNMRAMRADIRAHGKRCEIIGLTDGCRKSIEERLEFLGMLGDEPFFDHIHARREKDRPALRRADCLNPKYDHCFSERDVEAKKPMRALLEDAIVHHGFNMATDKVWYSGDSRRSDVLMANLTGVRVAWNQKGHDGFEEGPRMVLLSQISSLPVEKADQGALFNKLKEHIDPDLTIDHLHPDFDGKVFMHLTENDQYDRPRTPTPPPARLAAFEARVARARTIVDAYNEEADRQEKSHLRVLI